MNKKMMKVALSVIVMTMGSCIASEAETQNGPPISARSNDTFFTSDGMKCTECNAKDIVIELQKRISEQETLLGVTEAEKREQAAVVVQLEGDLKRSYDKMDLDKRRLVENIERVAELEKELQKALAENGETIRRHEDAMQSQKEDFEKKIEELHKEKVKFEVEFLSGKEANRQLQDDLNSKQTEIERLNSELEAIRKEREHLAAEVTNKHRLLTSGDQQLSKEHAEFKVENEALKEKLQQFEQQQREKSPDASTGGETRDVQISPTQPVPDPSAVLTADEVMALPAGEKGLWRKGADGLYHQKK